VHLFFNISYKVFDLLLIRDLSKYLVQNPVSQNGNHLELKPREFGDALNRISHVDPSFSDQESLTSLVSAEILRFMIERFTRYCT
jgi:hypothetical protein